MRPPSTPEPRAYRPTWAWVDGRFERRPVIEVDGPGGRIRERDGVLVPGLVNLHAHLELPPLATPPGIGLCAWVGMLKAGTSPSAAQAGHGVYEAIRSGTGTLADVGNIGVSASVMAAAGLRGMAFHEVLGIDVDTLVDTPTRAVPHAPHTTHPDVIQACASLDGAWSMHFDEDPDEGEFLRTGRGPWLGFMQRVGRDLSRFPIPGMSPARYLAELGVLSPRAMLVHATCTRGEDLDVIAESGATVVLCPRSNQHITGRWPDVTGLMERGVPLGIGTDSLASSPDLDVLAEATVLRRQFPSVAIEVWMRALTHPIVGEPGGWLLVDAPDPESLFDGTRWPRRWLACP